MPDCVLRTRVWELWPEGWHPQGKSHRRGSLGLSPEGGSGFTERRAFQTWDQHKPRHRWDQQSHLSRRPPLAQLCPLPQKVTLVGQDEGRGDLSAGFSNAGRAKWVPASFSHSSANRQRSDWKLKFSFPWRKYRLDNLPVGPIPAGVI